MKRKENDIKNIDLIESIIEKITGKKSGNYENPFTRT